MTGATLHSEGAGERLSFRTLMEFYVPYRRAKTDGWVMVGVGAISLFPPTWVFVPLGVIGAWALAFSVHREVRDWLRAHQQAIPPARGSRRRSMRRIAMVMTTCTPLSSLADGFGVASSLPSVDPSRRLALGDAARVFRWGGRIALSVSAVWFLALLASIQAYVHQMQRTGMDSSMGSLALIVPVAVAVLGGGLAVGTNGVIVLVCRRSTHAGLPPEDPFWSPRYDY